MINKPMNNKDNLYGWLFTYNPYTNLWNAATRDNYFLLFSNPSNELVLKAKDLKVLTELIGRTNGDAKLIKQLLNQ
jgi:hypothetical protein